MWVIPKMCWKICDDWQLALSFWFWYWNLIPNPSVSAGVAQIYIYLIFLLLYVEPIKRWVFVSMCILNFQNKCLQIYKSETLMSPLKSTFCYPRLINLKDINWIFLFPWTKNQEKENWSFITKCVEINAYENLRKIL